MYKLIAMNKQIDIKELLDWYIFAGVTDTCGDEVCLNIAQNKLESFKIEENKRPSPQQGAPISKKNVATNISRNANDICSKANSLEELKDILEKFEGCGLKSTAASTILGEGNSNAKIMLIGEAPGADEDRIGKPFIGKCGKLLDKMLNAIGLDRSECYITNILPWRPPGNRAPTDDELAICLPFLKRQIELIKPRFILLLGGIALKSVMDTTDSISRTRGKWQTYTLITGENVDVLATFHPSYLLRSSQQKSKAWTDLIRLKNKIEENK
jgi:DNA polymerase